MAYPLNEPTHLQSATVSPKGSRRGRRWWPLVLVGSVAVLVVLLVAIGTIVPFSSETLRRRVIAGLSERLDSDVELGNIQLKLLPRFHVQGSGLSIRKHDQPDARPLIKMVGFVVDAGFANLLRRHISGVTVTGLEINITHKDDGDRRDEAEASRSRKSATRESSEDGSSSGERQFVIDELNTVDARLNIIPSEAGKKPKVWAIHRLRMESVSLDRSMPFDADLTNAIPPAEIRTRGSFGPWIVGAPDATPLEGTFTMADADLGVFKGISGMLSAHGEFGGTLGRLGVHGETDTPQFVVTVSGHPVPLHADYHATVDGTNGNTLLDRIDATFLKTSLVAKGSVVGKKGQDGRTVTLDIDMTKARVEDVLKLAIKDSQPMTGAMKMRTHFVLPPGERDVVDKLRLDGRFEIATARFSKLDIQQKVDEMSRRSKGAVAASAQDGSSVVSAFAGRFKLAAGTLNLPELTFNMPGTSVRLSGDYKLRPGDLNFNGFLLLDATVSETQKGWKRLALKAFDPIFAKKGGKGTDLPIKIKGSPNDPKFGLDSKSLFAKKRGSQEPAGQ